MDTGEGSLRAGVVGTGSLGFHHARILRDVAGVSMKGAFEIRPERAQEVAGELEIPFHRELEKLLEEVDAVVIAVPTS
ncbi:MAG: Gfo/Idh/MocA family oxidoreductase, partial [Gemmatimonadota bacterium]